MNTCYFRVPEVLHISYNMCTHDLPDMHAWSPRATRLRAESIHIRQIPYGMLQLLLTYWTIIIKKLCRTFFMINWLENLWIQFDEQKSQKWLATIVTRFVLWLYKPWLLKPNILSHYSLMTITTLKYWIIAYTSKLNL